MCTFISVIIKKARPNSQSSRSSVLVASRSARIVVVIDCIGPKLMKLRALRNQTNLDTLRRQATVISRISLRNSDHCAAMRRGDIAGHVILRLEVSEAVGRDCDARVSVTRRKNNIRHKRVAVLGHLPALEELVRSIGDQAALLAGNLLVGAVDVEGAREAEVGRGHDGIERSANVHARHPVAVDGGREVGAVDADHEVEAFCFGGGGRTGDGGGRGKAGHGEREERSARHCIVCLERMYVDGKEKRVSWDEWYLREERDRAVLYSVADPFSCETETHRTVGSECDDATSMGGALKIKPGNIVCLSPCSLDYRYYR